MTAHMVTGADVLPVIARDALTLLPDVDWDKLTPSVRGFLSINGLTTAAGTLTDRGTRMREQILASREEALAAWEEIQ